MGHILCGRLHNVLNVSTKHWKFVNDSEKQRQGGYSLLCLCHNKRVCFSVAFHIACMPFIFRSRWWYAFYFHFARPYLHFSYLIFNPLSKQCETENKSHNKNDYMRNGRFHFDCQPTVWDTALSLSSRPRLLEDQLYHKCDKEKYVEESCTKERWVKRLNIGERERT